MKKKKPALIKEIPISDERKMDISHNLGTALKTIINDPKLGAQEFARGSKIGKVLYGFPTNMDRLSEKRRAAKMRGMENYSRGGVAKKRGK